MIYKLDETSYTVDTEFQLKPAIDVVFVGGGDGSGRVLYWDGNAYVAYEECETVATSFGFVGTTPPSGKIKLDVTIAGSETFKFAFYPKSV